MGIFSRLGRSAAPALVVAMTGPVGGCGMPSSPRAQTETESPFLDPSATWTDEAGHETRLADLLGEPVVLAPFFASCTVLCPLTVEKVRMLDQALRRRNLAARIVLVTLDPVHDGVDRLARFKETQHVPGSWHLLRGTVHETRALGRILGVRAIYDGAHIDHDVRIATFDASGRLVRTYGSWDFDEDEAAALLAPGSSRRSGDLPNGRDE
jgi:cytochrome oxidase Cu insertion factor (SCO1/SenC/PrrC family)